MQILPPTLPLTSSLVGISTGVDGQGKTAQTAQGEVARSRNVVPAEDASGGNNLSNVVTLSADLQPATRLENTISPIYAEIWKGGVKVAEVDIHGQVISSSGLVMPNTAGGTGPLVAAQRAAQVARQTGGEIRTAGQSLDAQTLLMRARLASAYSV